MSDSAQNRIPDTIATSLAGFTGREWVFRRLEAWLTATSPRTCLISGEPGCGKSTLAARLVQISAGETPPVNAASLKTNCVAYSHFCQALGSETSLDPLRFVESLSKQLADRYQPFAVALTQAGDQDITINATQYIETPESGAEIQNVVINELHIGNRSPRVAFDQVVRRPLEQLCTANFTETILILVDALDEALTYDKDENIATLLSQLTSTSTDLPRQVRFVLTSRPDPRVLHLIGKPSLDIITDAPDDIDDLREYTHKQLSMLSEPQRGQVADRVAKAGNGNFLYARYVLGDLIPRLDQNVDLSDLKLPEDLRDIYRQFLKRELGKNLERWGERFGPFLGFIVTARGQGLKRSQLAGIMGREQSEVGGMLLNCAQYLSGRQPDGPFHIYHQSFRDFLLTDSEYRVYPADANQAIARFLQMEYFDDWLHCQEDYALQYTPSHLMEAARTTEIRRLRKEVMDSLATLLTNLDFLEAKTAMLGVDSVLADLRPALTIIPSESESFSNILALLRVLDRESHHLRGWNRGQHPIFFAQQLHKRATDLGLPHIVTEVTTRLEHMHRPYLKLLWSRGSASPMLERTLLGHEEGVVAVTVTSDGQRIISGASDGTLKLWDLQTGQLVRTLAAREAEILALAVTPDRRQVLSGASDGTLKLWDLQTGQLVRILTELEWGITALAVTPDRRQVLSGASDGTLKLWDLQTGQLVHTFFRHEMDYESYHNLAITSKLAMTSDGRLALIAHKGELTIWDLQTGQLVRTLATREAEILALAVTPDGQHAFCGFRDGVLGVWDLQTGQCVSTLSAREPKVSVIAVTPDGQRVLCGFRGGALGVWDLQTGQLVRTLPGPESWVSAIVVTPDGRHVLCGFGDRGLGVWDLQTEQLVLTSGSFVSDILTAAFTSDGRFALGIYKRSGHGLIVWDLQTGEITGKISGHFENVNSLTITADGHFAISGSEDKSVIVWDLQTRQPMHSFLEDAAVKTVAVIHNSLRMIYGTNDGYLRVVDLQTREFTHFFTGHEGAVTALATTPDGRFVVSGSSDRTLRVWDLQTRQLMHVLTGHEGTVTALATTPDGRFVVSGSSDRTLRVWDLQIGQPVQVQSKVGSVLSAATVTLDGSSVIAGFSDGFLRVWDLETGQLIHTLTGHENVVYSVVATPDGRIAISCSADQTVRVWDLTSGLPIHILGIWDADPERPEHIYQARNWKAKRDHHAERLPEIQSVWRVYAITPDGRLAISGFGSSLRMWDLPAGRLIGNLTGYKDLIGSVSIAPDGRTAISSSVDGTIMVWDLTSGQSVHTLTGHKDPDISVAIAPDGHTSITRSGSEGRSDEQILRVWDLLTGQTNYALKGHREALPTNIVLTSDGHQAIASSEEGTLSIWDLFTGQTIHTLVDHKQKVTAIVVTPDERYAISGSVDHSLRVWDLQIGKEVACVLLEAGLVYLALAPDGVTIVAGDANDNTYCLRVIADDTWQGPEGQM